MTFNFLKRAVIGIVIALVLAAVCYALLGVESQFLEERMNVSPADPRMNQQVWIASFWEVGVSQLGTALFFTALWLLGSGFIFQISRWQKAKGRLIWWVLLLANALAAFVIGWSYLKPTLDPGKPLACLFLAFHATLIYYLATAIASPTTVKYAPAYGRYFGRINPIG